MSHHKTRQTPQYSEAVRKRTIWESYAVLPPKVRLNVSLALCSVAIAGIFISDYLEKAMHPPQKATSNPPK
ncbi:hypothetical protein F5148DRAFT_654060 [Russula earlei]|uniref:Uncharacterized protein n=1 Tax=Russula earlei TaxID=71964 RepID=A0ACC0UMD4_9AGAM|nr:hypothetical protein F5148DRAFT_654060 [Russula earlei]